MKTAFLAIALFAAAPAVAQATLQQSVEARLAEAGPGIRFGLVVATEDGREIVAISPEGRFIPASNTKMFTTAAAFATLTNLDAPDAEGGASVRLEGRNVVLEGRGDARLSAAADCVTDCLAALADAVAARTRRVRDVIGDDSFYPDERWSPGMSWNNIPTRSGTAISALTLDDNELQMRVFPGAPGRPPRLEVLPYYSVENRALTVGTASNLSYDRLPGSNILRLTGTIAVGGEPELLRLGIDDPAHYAAWRLRMMLEARHVRVTGTVSSRHRPPGDMVRAPQGEPLARLPAPPLIQDLILINKVSQNLHAELMLRRLGRLNGSGSIADGLIPVRAMLERAEVRRTDYDFSDGSGMSTYNRVAPRGMVRFLAWAAAQPWGAAWRTTLPIGGLDGTLTRRFRGTSLEGRLTAKTGTLNATAALSGYLVARSGGTLTFAFFANDIPEGAAATAAMDSTLELIADRN